jgi:hypothetical protein
MNCGKANPIIEMTTDMRMRRWERDLCGKKGNIKKSQE